MVQTNFSVKGNQEINFNIPNTLLNNTIYTAYFTVEDKTANQEMLKQLKIKERNLLANQNMGKNVSSSISNNKTFKPISKMSLAGIGGNSNSSGNPKAEETLSYDNDSITLGEHNSQVFQPHSGKTIYQMVFKTSKYNTFQEKMQALGQLQGTYKKYNYDFSVLKINSSPSIESLKYPDFPKTNYEKLNPIYLDIVACQGEHFDEYEMVGIAKNIGTASEVVFIPPLLQVLPGFNLSTLPQLIRDGQNHTLYKTADDLANAYLVMEFQNRKIRYKNSYGIPAYDISSSPVYYDMLNKTGYSNLTYNSSLNGNKREQNLKGTDRLRLENGTISYMMMDYQNLSLALNSYIKIKRYINLYYEAKQYAIQLEKGQISFNYWHEVLFPKTILKMITLNKWEATYKKYNSNDINFLNKQSINDLIEETVKKDLYLVKGNGYNISVKNNVALNFYCENGTPLSLMKQIQNMNYYPKSIPFESTLRFNYGYTLGDWDRYNSGDIKPKQTYALYPPATTFNKDIQVVSNESFEKYRDDAHFSDMAAMIAENFSNNEKHEIKLMGGGSGGNSSKEQRTSPTNGSEIKPRQPNPISSSNPVVPKSPVVGGIGGIKL